MTVRERLGGSPLVKSLSRDRSSDKIVHLVVRNLRKTIDDLEHVKRLLMKRSEDCQFDDPEPGSGIDDYLFGLYRTCIKAVEDLGHVREFLLNIPARETFPEVEAFLQELSSIITEIDNVCLDIDSMYITGAYESLLDRVYTVLDRLYKLEKNKQQIEKVVNKLIETVDTKTAEKIVNMLGHLIEDLTYLSEHRPRT